jgi:DNA-binding response OmpR family regulator
LKHLAFFTDDQALASAVIEQLELLGGFAITRRDCVNRADDARDLVHCDLVLLDADADGLNGPQQCRHWRGMGLKCPVLVLTGRHDDDWVVDVLDAGANDVVVKPLRFAILLARIRAQIRAYESSDESICVIGPYQFHAAGRTLMKGDEPAIRLTDKETAILKFLFRASGSVVARETLLTNVWGYNTAVSTHTLETHVYRLRRKIESDPTDAKILVTDDGGYRLAP